jgi:pyruvate ferredoxin oxidoreductase gamma subunit
MNADGGKIYEIIFHGRGGQGLITGMEILADVAFEDGFKDVLTIPIIGAERRGAPIRAFLRLSPDRIIKSYSAITNPDITVIFDQTLLELPGVGDSIKKGVVLINASDNFEYTFPEGVEVYYVNATRICIEEKLIIAGSPLINVPMAGAFIKIMSQLKLESLKNVLEERFGSKSEINMKAARKAYAEVKKGPILNRCEVNH